MSGVMITIGVVFVFFGAGIVLWAVRSAEPIAEAFRYSGAMYTAMGGVFVLTNAFPPDGRLYVLLAILGLVVFWTGWKHISILRRQSLESRLTGGAAGEHQPRE